MDMSMITDSLGSLGSGKLGHALIGLAILVIGLIVVKIVGGILSKVLGRVGFLGKHNLAKPIASLIKALLTIFVLMAVLQHFGMTDVLDPLKEMLNTFLSAIPKIIGAGVVAYAGYIIAKIVSGVVGAGMGKVDDQLATRLGNFDGNDAFATTAQSAGGFKLSKIASTFIFAAILIPVVVAALGVLNIPSISGPASDMLSKFMDVIPNIIASAVIFGVFFLVAKLVTSILEGILDGINLNAMPAKLGVDNMFSMSFTPIRLVTSVVTFFIMLLGFNAAIDALGIEAISSVSAEILAFAGGLLKGGVILAVGYFLSSIAYNKLNAVGAGAMAGIARIAIMGLVLGMGLRAMGLADNIVNMAFGFTLGSVAIAAALAFGFGGRDAARALTNSWASKLK